MGQTIRFNISTWGCMPTIKPKVFCVGLYWISLKGRYVSRTGFIHPIFSRMLAHRVRKIFNNLFSRRQQQYAYKMSTNNLRFALESITRALCCTWETVFAKSAHHATKPKYTVSKGDNLHAMRLTVLVRAKIYTHFQNQKKSSTADT